MKWENLLREARFVTIWTEPNRCVLQRAEPIGWLDRRASSSPKLAGERESIYNPIMPTVKLPGASVCSNVFATLLAATAIWTGHTAGLPKIGKIDFYGLHTVAEKEVRAKVDLKTGDPIPMEFRSSRGVPDEEKRKALGLEADEALPQDKAQIETRLATIPNVRRANLSSVCCEPDGSTTLFIGIEEAGARSFSYRKIVGEKVLLPDEMIETYKEFMDAVMQGVRRGNLKEDDSQGHALFSDETIRPIQEKFLLFARRDALLLKEVLAGSQDARHRAVAASILGYSLNKAAVLPELMSAVRDPDEGVRNNSTRAIGAMAGFIARQPEGTVRIAPDTFVAMLDSLSWSDRNKAMRVLLELTKTSESARAMLRQEAISSLIEMARWKDSHSLMALQLIGRIYGRDDDEVNKAWESGQRENIIKTALKQEAVAQKVGSEKSIAGLRLCWCPPGHFIMGSPRSEPERRPGEDQASVTISKGFWMAKFETTQGQWKQVMEKLPAPPTAELPADDELPVGNVNFGEVEEFCRKLTRLARESGELPEGWEFRLPTEAQWEYACRAGTTTATAFGDKLSSTQANFKGKPYNGAEPGPSLGRAAKVGSYPANAWGLHDMHGNTFEWCRDWYHPTLPGGTDPDLSGSPASSRVRRGGCWADEGWPCRSAFRLRFEPERRYDHIGFRVALVQS